MAKELSAKRATNQPAEKVRDEAPSVLADFEETTREANNCRRMADAMLDAAVLDSPFEVVSLAAKSLYQYQWNFFHLARRHPPVMERIRSIAEAADVNADYGIGITATTCHDIAWHYANSVLSVLHKYDVGGVCMDDHGMNLPARSESKLMEMRDKLTNLPPGGSFAGASNIDYADYVLSALDRQYVGRLYTDGKAFISPDQLKNKWPTIRRELKKLPRIDSRFDGTFQREAARARQELLTEQGKTAKLPKSSASATDRERMQFAEPYRNKTKPVTWNRIAEMWRQKTGEKCNESTMRQSWYRAKKAGV